MFTGCTISVCVESTVKDAMFRDYHCLLLEDCTAEAIGADLSHVARALMVPRVVRPGFVHRRSILQPS